MARNSTVRLIRSLVRAIAALALAVVALVVVYAVAAVAISSFSANPDWKQAATGVRIYVIDNGIHTDLVLPSAVADVDWSDLIRPEDLRNPEGATAGYLVFGWGDRNFYLNTPRWRDIDPLRTAQALVGAGESVLHVVHRGEPQVGAKVHAIVLTPEEYHRLADFVRGTFAVRANGRAPSVHGYGRNDAFYEAKEGYSAITTCNEWTGRALRTAGVRMGAWTPLPFTVMRWL